MSFGGMFQIVKLSAGFGTVYMLRTFNIVLPYGILLNARFWLGGDFGKICKYMNALRALPCDLQSTNDIEQFTTGSLDLSWNPVT